MRSRDTGEPLGGRDLPAYIDEHTITITASRHAVWTSLRTFVGGMVRDARTPLGSRVERLLGTEPRSGFAVAQESPERRIVLVGQHRFARYRLEFELTDGAAGITVTARSFGDFFGHRGRCYRLLVVGTRGHVLVVRRMLRTIRSRSMRD